MTSTPQTSKLLLNSIADEHMNYVYECIENHPGTTTSEALCRCLVATDIHSQVQTLIMTGRICTKQSLVEFLLTHVTDQLVIENEFEEVLIRPVGCS